MESSFYKALELPHEIVTREEKKGAFNQAVVLMQCLPLNF
jgi:hypothetical protein